MTIYQELLELIPQSGAVNYEKFMDYFPSLEILKTTPQDAHYHAEGDVWTHTKMVCDELLKLAEYKNAAYDSKFVMFYSALLHDISKPACTKLEEDGRITSAGHSKRGCIDARIDLWKKEIPFDLRERICNIIATHQVPFFAFADTKGGKPQRTPEFIAHSLSHQLNLNELLAVAKSDMLGRTYVGKQACLDDIALFELVCREQDCYDKPKSFPDLHTKMEYFRHNGQISPDYPFYKETGSHVIVLSGLPATGKNTFIAQNYPEMPVVSFDDAKEELGLSHGDNPGRAVHLVTDTAKQYLREKKDFIFNATHLSGQMRKKTLDLLFGYDAHVKIVYLEAPEKDIKARNNARDSSLPNKKIDEMLFKWEVPTSMEAHEVQYIPNHGLKKKMSLKG